MGDTHAKRLGEMVSLRNGVFGRHRRRGDAPGPGPVGRNNRLADVLFVDHVQCAHAEIPTTSLAAAIWVESRWKALFARDALPAVEESATRACKHDCREIAARKMLATESTERKEETAKARLREKRAKEKT